MGKKKGKARRMLGHVTIQIRGDENLKQRLENLYLAYSDSLSRSVLSQLICEFVLFIHRELENGAELILRKNDNERKIHFPPKLTLQFYE